MLSTETGTCVERYHPAEVQKTKTEHFNTDTLAPFWTFRSHFSLVTQQFGVK